MRAWPGKRPMSPQLEPVTNLIVELSRPHEMGEGPAGARRIIPIVGGSATGAQINGRILPVGADWQTVTANGVAQLDARYAIQTDDGAVIEVISQGIRHTGNGGEPYMRTFIRLETGAAAYDWVNRALFMASGGKVESAVHLAIFRIT